jgi:hypothetical protein
VKKWIGLLIQQSADTRAELWKGFNVARQLLGKDFPTVRQEIDLVKSNS